MNTPQPAALPDLTAVIAWLENGCDPREAVKELKHYQSKLQALATLQSQPAAAGVSDEPTDEQIAAGMRELFAGPKPWPSWETTLKRVYQAMSALRPQAVPMTDEQAKQFLKRSALLDMFLHIGWYSAPRKGFDEHALSLIRAVEAHHGITAQGGEGEQG